MVGLHNRAQRKGFGKPEGDSTRSEGKKLLFVNAWSGTILGIKSKMPVYPSEVTFKPTI